MLTLLRDFRQAFRRLARTPGFAALAIAIGGNAAVETRVVA
jgi:hypothetical protein